MEDPIAWRVDFDEDESEEPPLDPAYIKYLATLTLEPGKRKRTAGDEPLKMWLPEREKFLDELISHEGRGATPPEGCLICNKGPAEYRCTDCYGGQLTCGPCMVKLHKTNPLHKIKKWNGRHFETSTFKSLGLRVQLGHVPGEVCPNPEPCYDDDFTIIDTDAIHAIGLDFCACGISAQSRTVQLLRAQYFPATVVNPKSAATFRSLEVFELLSYESKASAFEFYQALARLTDNTGIDPPKDRYPEFLRMIREWRHLKMLKRAGRGHDPEGISATKPGECAVECPACPQPGKNLPPGWEDAPEEKQYLYSLFLGLDANFRLKRKDVSNDNVDPGLGDGYAYFVEERKYKEHLDKFKDEKEPKSSCSRHDAVNLSEAKPGQDHAATGLGKVGCVRHDMHRPLGAGDLQKGERYCNMDYMFHRTLCDSEVTRLVVSYDIACQWSINFQDRMLAMDHEFRLLDDQVHIVFLVPKFHLPAHVASCRSKFSFNYTKGVGRTDGEAPERGWADVNPLAPSTKEMGPGSRRDTMDCHLGDSNWKKVTGFGASLLRKVKAAASDMVDHAQDHLDIQKTIPPALASKWTREVEAWESDPTKPNPFDGTVATPTQAAVRRQLAEIEARELAAGRDFALDESVSPSVLISSGIDLEAEQRAVKHEYSKLWTHAQDRQHAKLQLRSNALQRKLAAWFKHQQLYMPSVVILRHKQGLGSSPDDAPKPHEVSLWLPSQIRAQVPFDARLASIEWQLRTGQAYESLASIRHNLQIRSHLYKFKDRFVRGQSANTRARNAIDLVQARVDAGAREYRAAHTALLSLGAQLGKLAELAKLPKLDNSDIRELAEGEEGTSEGRKKTSWIWKTVGVGALEGDEGFIDALRIEWCKSRARAQRFNEEVELLLEEMQRVLRFFTWQERDWKEKANLKNWHGISKGRAEGLVAYAERQAALRRRFHDHFKEMWTDAPRYVCYMKGFLEEQPTVATDESESGSPSVGY